MTTVISIITRLSLKAAAGGPNAHSQPSDAPLLTVTLEESRLIRLQRRAELDPDREV